MADNVQLERWLAQRQEQVKLPVAKAIYEGLRMRVARGDFDPAGNEADRMTLEELVAAAREARNG